MGETRQQVAGTVEDCGDVGLAAAERALDLGARSAVPTSPTSEIPSTKSRSPSWVGTRPAGNMRRIKQAEMLEILHHVPDRGGRYALAHRARQGA